MTDQAYLELIHAGNMDGLAELQRRYWSPVLSCAKAGFDKYELQRDDIYTPEDVAQQVFYDFARFVRKNGSDTVSNIIAYLCRMAKNRALKVLKMQHGYEVKDDAILIYPSGQDIEGEYIKLEVEAERYLLAFAVFYQLLYNEDIPARQRLALILRGFGEMSSEEIGAIVEVKPSSVDSLVSQARAKLRKIFGIPTPDKRRKQKKGAA